MPDKLNKAEYFALEIHYDNPDIVGNFTFPTGARIFYTNKTREIEVGHLTIDHAVDSTLLVPPNVTNFVTIGHCSSECTEIALPEGGITIFKNLFHAHVAGRKLKLRHFRGTEELPWADVDEYYDFNFQQNNPLKNPINVRKGDQLTVECTYGTTKFEDGKAVIGGLSTRDEMCEAIVYYYPRLPLIYCVSSQKLDVHMSYFGITNYTYKNLDTPGVFPEIEILEPSNMAGDYRDSISVNVNWTKEFVGKYQEFQRYGEHIGRCVIGDETFLVPVKYPEEFVEYVPPNECKASKADRFSGLVQFVFAFILIVQLLN